MVAGLNGDTRWPACAQRALRSLLLPALHQLHEAADAIRVHVEPGFGLGLSEALPGSAPLAAELPGPGALKKLAQIVGERLERFFDELHQILEHRPLVGFDSVQVEHLFAPSRRMRSSSAASTRTKKEPVT